MLPIRRSHSTAILTAWQHSPIAKFASRHMFPVYINDILRSLVLWHQLYRTLWCYTGSRCPKAKYVSVWQLTKNVNMRKLACRTTCIKSNYFSRLKFRGFLTNSMIVYYIFYIWEEYFAEIKIWQLLFFFFFSVKYIDKVGGSRWKRWKSYVESKTRA